MNCRLGGFPPAAIFMVAFSVTDGLSPISTIFTVKGYKQADPSESLSKERIDFVSYHMGRSVSPNPSGTNAGIRSDELGDRAIELAAAESDR